MTTMMTKLTVKCPRGQRDEVFRDSAWDQEWQWNEDWREVRVFSYEVLQGNVLKIYSHKVRTHRRSGWEADEASEGMEIAHFRPNQWDKVRSG